MARKPQPADTGTASPAGKPRKRKRHWFLKSSLVFVLLLALAILIADLMLPSYLEKYVNRVLDQSPDYDGRIGKIDVDLWRGAYTINDVKIVKTSNAIPVPFFAAKKVDLALQWKALFHGAARGKMTLEEPRINFVSGPTTEETQTGANEPWIRMISELFPFRIDQCNINDGRIHFRAFHTNPRVDVYLSDVQGEITNLTNIEDKTDPLIAHVYAKGNAMKSGKFEFDMNLDPQAYHPTFDMALRLLDMDVTKLNDLTLAYGNFDFSEGRFDFVVEANAKDGLIHGYAKPLFRGAKVLSWSDVKNDTPIQLIWETAVGIAGEVFKNQSADQFGTLISLEGDLNDPQTDTMEIIGNTLRNAFVEAYLPRLERRPVAPPQRKDLKKELTNESP